MPDVKISGIGAMSSAANPLQNKPGSLLFLRNMVSDINGWATKRRGIKQLNATTGYTSVLTTLDAASAYVVSSWCFDDHLFVYVEDVNGKSGIAAYSMVTSAGWHKVVESTSAIRTSTVSNIRPCISDRRLLLATSSGVKRIPSIYDNYYPKGSTTPVNYSDMYRSAGIPRSTDPRCRNAVAGGATDHGLIALTGFEWLGPSSAVGYRIAWYKRDENGIPSISAPSGRIVVRNTSTTTSYATRLKVIIPSGVTDSSYIMQVYRTTVIEMDGSGVIPDPGDNEFLAGEYRLTSTDLSNGYALYEDVSFDPLLGAALYTNENQEGNAAARYQPPLCRDIASFGGCSFFSCTTERQRLTLKVLAVDSSGVGTYKGIRVGDRLVVGDLVMVGVATANEDVTDYNFAVDATTGAGSEVIRALKTTESIVYKYNLWSNKMNGRYAAYNMTSNDDVFGVIMLEEKSVGGSTGVYLGVDRVDAPVQILPAPVFTSTPSNTLALAAAVVTNVGPTTVTVTTASNHNLTTNDLIFLAPFAASTEAGTSSPRCANTDVPAGVYQVTVTGATTFTFPAPSGSASNQTDARAATTGAYVHKIFDVTSSVWTEARSKNSYQGNRLMWSAPFEPECAPPSNTVDLGAADKQIIRIVPTQDTLFIFKEDGVWRLKGDSGDWEIIVLDKAAVLAAPESPGVVDGRVFLYATTGIIGVDDGGASKISTPVGGVSDNFYRATAQNPTRAIQYVGCGHGEDQAYILSFGSDTFRYHCPTRTWSRHQFNDDVTITDESGVSFITTAKASRYTSYDAQAYSERLVVCFNTAVDCIGIERKTGTDRELCDIDVPVSVSSFNSSANTVTLASVPASVEVGSMFMWYANATYSPGGYGAVTTTQYRGTISAINGNVLTLDISGNITQMSSWHANDGTYSGSVLRKITAQIWFSPIMVGDGFSPGHFSELEVSLGSLGNFSKCSVCFVNEVSYPTSVFGLSESASFNGYYARNFSASRTIVNRGEHTMPGIMAFRAGVPRTNAMATSLIVSLTNDRAYEQFDVAGIRLMFNQADNRARRTNG